jgi:hypothetical protein
MDNGFVLPQGGPSMSPVPNADPHGSDSRASENLDQRLHDAAQRAEQEIRSFIRYLDDEVVPEVRRNSSTALRAASVQLQKLADSMDTARSRAAQDAGKQPTPGPNTPPHA